MGAAASEPLIPKVVGHHTEIFPFVFVVLDRQRRRGSRRACPSVGGARALRTTRGGPVT